MTIDFFRGRLEGLILAEVEFASEEARDLFTVPEGWDEKTGDVRFSAGYLATSYAESV